VKPNAAFAPGFRISELDVAFIIAAVLLSILLARSSEQLSLAVLFAVSHFFLFCNILRAKRALELLWAATFVGLWSASYVWGVPTWPQTYAIALVATVVVAVVQVLLPSYHGAFWSTLNPRLPQWWEQNGGAA